MQLKSILIIGVLEHPPHLVRYFWPEVELIWYVLLLRRKYGLCFRVPNVSPVVTGEKTWVGESLLVSTVPSGVCLHLLFWLVRRAPQGAGGRE